MEVPFYGVLLDLVTPSVMYGDGDVNVMHSVQKTRLQKGIVEIIVNKQGFISQVIRDSMVQKR